MMKWLCDWTTNHRQHVEGAMYTTIVFLALGAIFAFLTVLYHLIIGV